MRRHAPSKVPAVLQITIGVDWLTKPTIALLHCVAGPTIRRSPPARFSIYADDHIPPHFRIEGRGFRAIVEIRTMIVRVGETRRAADATSWARENIGLLRTEWARLTEDRS
jgi:hypothetical protein